MRLVFVNSKSGKITFEDSEMYVGKSYPKNVSMMSMDTFIKFLKDNLNKEEKEKLAKKIIPQRYSQWS